MNKIHIGIMSNIQFGMSYGMMDDYGGMMNGFGMGYRNGILELIFWILVIIGSVLLIKYMWEGAGAKREQESALEVLKKRYARGDISKEEFEQKKKDLEEKKVQ